MKNHQSCPTGIVVFLEANVNSSNNHDGYCGRGRGHYQGRGGHNKKSKPNHQKQNNNDEDNERDCYVRDTNNQLITPFL